MNILLVAPDRGTLASRLRGMEHGPKAAVISRIIRSEADLHSIRGLRFDAVFGMETVDAEFRARILLQIQVK